MLRPNGRDPPHPWPVTHGWLPNHSVCLFSLSYYFTGPLVVDVAQASGVCLSSRFLTSPWAHGKALLINQLNGEED